MLDNADYLVENIDKIIVELQNYRNALDEKNAEKMQELLKQGTDIKEKIEKDKPKKWF